MTPPWSDAVDGSLSPLLGGLLPRYPVAPSTHRPDGRIGSIRSTPNRSGLFQHRFGPPASPVLAAVRGAGHHPQQARQSPSGGGQPDLGPASTRGDVDDPGAAGPGQA